MINSHQYCTLTHLHTRSWWFSQWSFRMFEKCPLTAVCSFMGSNVNSSSFAVISVNTIQTKMHIWAVSLASVDSSNCSEKRSHSAMFLWSCCVKSLAITSQHCVTVLLDSWWNLIDDNITGLFLKSWNKESAASTKASFIILPLNKVQQTKQRINGAPVSLYGGNSTNRIHKLASGGSMHTAGVMQETKRPTAAERARRWITLRLWWREDQRSNDGQSTEHRASRFES